MPTSECKHTCDVVITIFAHAKLDLRTSMTVTPVTSVSI